MFTTSMFKQDRFYVVYYYQDDNLIDAHYFLSESIARESAEKFEIGDWEPDNYQRVKINYDT